MHHTQNNLRWSAVGTQLVIGSYLARLIKVFLVNRNFTKNRTTHHRGPTVLISVLAPQGKAGGCGPLSLPWFIVSSRTPDPEVNCKTLETPVYRVRDFTFLGIEQDLHSCTSPSMCRTLVSPMSLGVPPSPCRVEWRSTRCHFYCPRYSFCADLRNNYLRRYWTLKW